MTTIRITFGGETPAALDLADSPGGPRPPRARGPDDDGEPGAIVAAYEAGKGRWTGREWSDPERVMPDTTDEQIVGLLRAREDGRLDVTRWGIPDDGSPESQRWRERRNVARERLSEAARDLGLDAAGTRGDYVFGSDGRACVEGEVADRLREACDTLRALAAQSDAGVAAVAEAAANYAAEAVRLAREGDLDGALAEAEKAASCERQFGDDPTWGPLLQATREAVEARDEALACDGEGEDALVLAPGGAEGEAV